MKYERVPGIIHDLIKVIHFYFNKQMYKERPILGNYDIMEAKIKSIIDGIQIDEKLFIFFYTVKSGSFMAETFFRNHKCDLISPDAFDLMIESIRNINLFNELLKYCTNTENKDFEENLSVNYLYELLSGINMPDRLKLQILHFNNNKKLYTELLINTLMEVYKRVEEFYDNELYRLDDVHELLKDEKLQINVYETALLNPDSKDNYFYSTSLVQENFLFAINSMGYLGIMFGYNTLQNFNELTTYTRKIDVTIISKSFSDDLRRNILNVLKQNSELPYQEIAKLLGKGPKAVWYQLEQLVIAQLVKTRDTNENLLYSLNFDFINEYADYINNFASFPGRKL